MVVVFFSSSSLFLNFHEFHRNLMRACVNPELSFSNFHFVYQLDCLITQLISTKSAPAFLLCMYSVKSSGLSNDINVVNRNVYTAGQKLP